MVRKRAFTLIELLVVVAIIAVLTSILLPALSRAREQSKFVTCQTNLRTIGHGVQYYLEENRDIYPVAPFYGCLGYVGRSPYHTLLGSQIPESQRPLNKYFAVEDSHIEGQLQTTTRKNYVFECPSDKGDAYFKLPGTFFVEHGTSYTYASEEDEPFVPTFGVLSCRGLPASKIKYPAKKIVFQEPVFNPSFDMRDDLAHWHHRKRNHGNILFADGHVDFLFTQIFDYAQPPDEHEVYY